MIKRFIQERLCISCDDMSIDEVVNYAIKTIKLNNYVMKMGNKIYDAIESSYTFPTNKIIKIKTKWEKFAEKKGIKLKKKSKMVFDEDLKKYIPRYGTLSKKNYSNKIGITETTFSNLKREKNKRIQKNIKNKINNQRKMFG